VIINKQEYTPGLNRESCADGHYVAHLYKGWTKELHMRSEEPGYTKEEVDAVIAQEMRDFKNQEEPK
jgi:hypothetical protein